MPTRSVSWGFTAIIILVATAIAALAWRALGTEAGVTYLAMGAFAALAANWGLALGFAELETRNSRVYSVPKLRPLDSESLHREPPSFLVDDATPKQNGRPSHGPLIIAAADAP